jgi:hypothetical protein
VADIGTVREALGLLDPAKDEHWTSQGLPRLDVLVGLMGFSLERRELNELVPGFSRASAKKAKEESGPAPAPDPSAAPSLADDLRRHSDATFRHMLARAERRKAALAHLASGGFTLADLQDSTSPLQRRVSAQNRQARRELS